MINYLIFILKKTLLKLTSLSFKIDMVLNKGVVVETKYVGFDKKSH
jgi:hypothetical protein